MTMRVFDWIMNALAVMVIMCVVFLRLNSVGAIVLTVFAFGWLARFSWGKDDV